MFFEQKLVFCNLCLTYVPKLFFVPTNLILLSVRSFEAIVWSRIIKIKIYGKYHQAWSLFWWPRHVRTRWSLYYFYPVDSLVLFTNSFGRVQTFYRLKNIKITPKNKFFAICAQTMCLNYFLCLQMNSADHCGHFEVLIVAIAQPIS